MRLDSGRARPRRRASRHSHAVSCFRAVGVGLHSVLQDHAIQPPITTELMSGAAATIFRSSDAKWVWRVSTLERNDEDAMRHEYAGAVVQRRLALTNGVDAVVEVGAIGAVYDADEAGGGDWGDASDLRSWHPTSSGQAMHWNAAVVPTQSMSTLLVKCRSKADTLDRWTPGFQPSLWLRILACVQQLHDHGVTHGDVKASNVAFDDVLDPSTVQLLDFGQCGVDAKRAAEWDLGGTPVVLTTAAFAAAVAVDWRRTGVMLLKGLVPDLLSRAWRDPLIGYINDLETTPRSPSDKERDAFTLRGPTWFWNRGGATKQMEALLLMVRDGTPGSLQALLTDVGRVKRPSRRRFRSGR